MKSLILDPLVLTITIIFSIFTFICSYFLEIYMSSPDQYIGVIAVSFLDGIFAIIANYKKEGFKTNKAIKILKTISFWIIILTVILIIEKAFSGTSWLSEVIIVPFIVFQLISTLKNASLAGYIKVSLLNDILNKIDKHKTI